MKKLLLLICLLWNTTSYADFENYELFGMNMPMMCGTPESVDRYIEDNSFTPINISFGKERAKPDGIALYAVTYYINDKAETLAVAETPTDPYKCMIFHTFDMKMNQSLLGTGT